MEVLQLSCFISTRMYCRRFSHTGHVAWNGVYWAEFLRII